MTEEIPKSTLEHVKNETIQAIRDAIIAKLDNPEIIRQDPSSGYFVLEDSEQEGHSYNTQILVERAGKKIDLSFNENFLEPQGSGGPSLLTIDYHLSPQGELIMIPILDPDHGNVAYAKLEHLTSNAILLPSDQSFHQKRFIPSETLAQELLTSVKSMKIYIR
jgi:hypothetical protein